MGLSGTVVVVVKLTTDVVAVGCCILRYYILRKQSRQTTGSKLAHALFALAILCEVTATILSTAVLVDGDRYIKKHGMEAALLYLLNEWLLRVTFFAHLMYYLAECVLKAAYLAFYTDLYSRVQTKRKIAVWLATFVWAASYLAAFVMLFTYCAPLEANWKVDGTNPRCPVLFNVPTFFVLAGANILSDIAILIVPLLIISSMRLGRTEKYSLALVFSIGMISIAASVIRAGIVGERFVSQNHTWDTVWVWMLWSHAEMFFGVIAFTLPSFRYILLRGINKVSSSSRNRGYGSMKSSSRGKSQKLQDSHNGTMGSRIGGRSGVLVETTVTLKEEHRFRSDSETELTAIKGSSLQKPANYEWKMDSRTDSM